MPTITRKEFAELCGDDEKKLNVYISRGKVSTVPNNKKLIDTTNPVNSAFMNDRQMANQLKSAGAPVTKPAKIVTEKSHVKLPNKKIVELQSPSKKAVNNHSTAPKTKINKIVKVQLPKPTAIPKSIARQIAVQTSRDMKRVDQDVRKKELEIENLELAKQQKELLLQKSAGQLLPVDLTRGIIERNASSIFKSFEQGLDRLAAIYCNVMAGGDRAMMGKIITQGKEILGECIAEAGKLTAAEINILVTDFSQQLMRGQKKV